MFEIEQTDLTNVEELDEQISKRYKIISKLGKGGYGVVWKAVDLYSTNRHPVALKKVFNAFKTSHDAQKIYREVSYLLELRGHPFIINLHHVYRSGDDRDIYLVFDLMETDLNLVIQAKSLQDIHQRYIFWQLLTVLKFIHSAHLMHRDLKPSNVLINSDSVIKLCDFGLSRTFSAVENSSSSSESGFALDDFPNFVATRWYRPPEILFGSKYQTPAIDMWSAGCILAELVTGKPLFPGTSSIDQIERVIAYTGKLSEKDFETIHADDEIKQYVLPKLSYKYQKFDLESELKNAPADAVDLIKKLVCFNLSSRLSAEKALEHPYVKQFHSPRKEIKASRAITLSLDDNKKFTVRDYKSTLYKEAVTSPDIPISKLKK